MRLRTTEIVVGNAYTFRWNAWDGMNRFVYTKYPGHAKWVVSGGDRSFPAASPPNGTTVEVVAAEVAYLDHKGHAHRTSNYRGRPYVLVRDGSGATYVPIDPQNLYPAGEVPDARRSGLAVAGWLIALPLTFVTIVLGIDWLSGPPEGVEPIPSPVGIGSLAVGAAILGFAVRWLIRQLSERRSEGVLWAALRTGLVVGIVLAVAAIVRAALGLGE